ncbi:MAG: RNA polymerase sigma factor, partial [Fimbriimonadales bacterium]
LDAIIDREEVSADENAAQAERADLVRRYVGALNDRCRELLSMLYLRDDPSYIEVAEKLGMPIGAIGPTRARCLDKLRRDLERGGFFG